MKANLALTENDVFSFVYLNDEPVICTATERNFNNACPLWVELLAESVRDGSIDKTDAFLNEQPINIAALWERVVEATAKFNCLTNEKKDELRAYGEVKTNCDFIWYW